MVRRIRGFSLTRFFLTFLHSKKMKQLTSVPSSDITEPPLFCEAAVALHHFFDVNIRKSAPERRGSFFSCSGSCKRTASIPGQLKSLACGTLIGQTKQEQRAF